MNESDVLIRQRQKYMTLLDQVSSTCNYLNQGISKIDSVSNKVSNGYSIDSASADQGFLGNTANEARGLHTNLLNNVIPAINRKINNMTDQISDAMIKEDLERKEKEKR